MFPGCGTAEKAWWYGGVPRASHTWSGAENWYRFARNHSKRVGVITNVWHMNRGDVLQYKRNGLANMDHSTIVTYKNGGDIRLTYHTSDTHNKPLKDIINSDRTFFAHAT